jgi:hypothetical protein
LHFSIAFFNCIFQLHFSIAFFNCIFQLHFSIEKQTRAARHKLTKNAQTKAPASEDAGAFEGWLQLTNMLSVTGTDRNILIQPF